MGQGDQGLRHAPRGLTVRADITPAALPGLGDAGWTTPGLPGCRA